MQYYRRNSDDEIWYHTLKDDGKKIKKVLREGLKINQPTDEYTGFAEEHQQHYSDILNDGDPLWPVFLSKQPWHLPNTPEVKILELTVPDPGLLTTDLPKFSAKLKDRWGNSISTWFNGQINIDGQWYSGYIYLPPFGRRYQEISDSLKRRPLVIDFSQASTTGAMTGVEADSNTWSPMIDERRMLAHGWGLTHEELLTDPEIIAAAIEDKETAAYLGDIPPSNIRLLSPDEVETLFKGYMTEFQQEIDDINQNAVRAALNNNIDPNYVQRKSSDMDDWLPFVEDMLGIKIGQDLGQLITYLEAISEIKFKPKAKRQKCKTHRRRYCDECLRRNPLHRRRTKVKYRRNSDEELRGYQRLAASGDIDAETKVLQLRIRADDLDPHHVELAAYLGDKASLMLFPNPPGPPEYMASEVAWTLVSHRDFNSIAPKVAWTLHHGNLNSRLLVTIAADFARHVLHIWKDEYPADDEPQLAIQSARDWVDGEVGASERADAASEVAALAADSGDPYSASAHAGGAAAHSAAAAAAEDANEVSRQAYWAANTAVRAAAWWGHSGDEEEEVEREWQRRHLIEMLLA